MAATQAAESQAPLASALAEIGTITFGNGWATHEPTALISESAGIGLPRLGMCSTDSVVAATRMLVACQMRAFNLVHADLRVRLTRFLEYEAFLWDLAAKHGGPTSRLPYAYRYRAIEWFWSPEAHRYRDAVALCLRCGDLYTLRRPPENPGEPRCPHCAKEPPSSRREPRRAVAPAERGRWWLRCLTEGCDDLFVGRAQARRCPNCRSARVSPGKRRPRSPM